MPSWKKSTLFIRYQPNIISMSMDLKSFFQKTVTHSSAPLSLALVVLLVTACSSNSLTKAPVEYRRTPGSRGPVPSIDTNTAIKVVPPGTDNAGKPGYYVVKPGDTLMRIGVETGQNWREIARWNQLENPSVIEIGQVLRVTPPSNDAVVAKPVPTANNSTVTPLPTQQSGTGNTATAPNAPVIKDDTDINWIWPTQGAVVAGFDETKNKGLDLAGNIGDPVLAAADGRVVYAGAGLRGYGNLVILKHNNTFLTAYAHNQSLLVKEDQAVKQGQKIAEMGSSDADRVKLHFEIRRQGKPVDPSKYLPTR